MNVFKQLKRWYIIILIGLLTLLYLRLEYKVIKLQRESDELNNKLSVIPIQMHDALEKYSDSFNVPKHVAYNVAYLESRYKGPLHWDYNPSLTSSSGAVGPMQIIPRYAHKFAGRKLSVKELKNNIDLNVMVSMKMLRKWHSIHHDWTLACGAYNTGQPVRNSYAQYATSNINYKNKWNKL